MLGNIIKWSAATLQALSKENKSYDQFSPILESIDGNGEKRNMFSLMIMEFRVSCINKTFKLLLFLSKTMKMILCSSRNTCYVFKKRIIAGKIRI
jgi:hypothetical protein